MSVFVRSEHEQKFDRQTRIWGSHGQETIETAKVCMLNACATSAETLKNLVLPNVGFFTLVDAALVTQADLGTNFFVTTDSVGKPLAEVVRDNLLEMNDSVTGKAVIRDPADIIEKDLDFFKDFDVVVASQLQQKHALALAEYLFKANIPFVNVRSYGLIGSIRFAMPHVDIVETHYTNDRFDLFIHPKQLAHFPELQAYVDNFPAFDTLDTTEHAHIPYIVILIRLCAQWMKDHGGEVPKTWDDSEEFKQSILKAANDFGKEGNFQEAEQFAHRVYRLPQLDDSVQAVLDDPRSDNITAQSSNFWILTRAVKEFMKKEGHGFAPVCAEIPDMTSQPKDYVRLTQVYKQRNANDVSAVTKHAAALLAAAGLPADRVPEREVEYFVKNFRGIASVSLRSMAQEYGDEKEFRSEDINEEFEEWEPEPEDPDCPRPKDLHWYFALRAADEFHGAHGRYPGSSADSVDDDATKLVELQTALFKKYGIRTPVIKECLKEICRFGASEIHNIAALMGGIASQEVLKIILRQFVPMNNTVIYNGIHERQTMYTL